VGVLLGSASDALWERIAQKGYPDRSLYPEIDERLRRDRAAMEAAEKDPLRRLSRLLQSGEQPSTNGSEIRLLIASDDFPIFDQNAWHVIHEAYNKAPNAVSNAFMDRLEHDFALPRGAGEYLRHAQKQIDSGSLADAVLQSATANEVSLSIAAAVGPEVVGRLIDDAVSLHTKWRAAPNHFLSEDRDRSTIIGDLVAQTRLGAFAEALLKRPPDTVTDTIGKLAELFTRHCSNEEGRVRRLPENQATAIDNLIIGWGEVLLSTDPFPRSAAGQLAWLLGRLPNPVLLPMLERLLAFDLAGRQKALAVAVARRPGYEAALVDARTLYSPAYQQAFVANGSEAAVKVLQNYLDNSEFGFTAAVAIKQIWDHDNSPTDKTLMHWPNYSQVRAKRAERDRGEVPQADSPFASMIFTAVDRLKDSNDPKQCDLAITVARIGFGLPHKDRPELVGQLLSVSGNQSARQLLLASLALDGIIVPAEIILDGIRVFVEEANSKTWMFRDCKWQLDGWFELFAFSDRPMAVLEAMALIPPTHATAHQFERMLRAFGQSPSTEADGILKELANRDPQFRDVFEWLAAFENRGTEEAARDILSFVATGAVKLSGHRHDIGGLGRSIAQMMKGNSSIRNGLLQMYRTMPPGSARSIVEVAFSEAPDDTAILAMIEMHGAEGRLIHQTVLFRAIELVMTEHRPSSYWHGSYDVVLLPSHELRKRIFGLTDGDGKVAVLATECLIMMDVIRDRGNWAEAKPRHPDIRSGRAWPLRLPCVVKIADEWQSVFLQSAMGISKISE
jgi:hypothetical protein